jgi:hypothetical protein
MSTQAPTASKKVGHIRIGAGSIVFAGRNVGYLTGGVVLAAKYDLIPVPNVDGLWLNAKNDLMGKGLTIKAVLYETTLDNLKLAFNSNSAIEEVNNPDDSYRRLKVDAQNYLAEGPLEIQCKGPKVGGIAKDWTITIYKAQLTNTGEIKIGQDEHTKIGVEFQAIYDEDHDGFIFEVKETVAA